MTDYTNVSLLSLFPRQAENILNLGIWDWASNYAKDEYFLSVVGLVGDSSYPVRLDQDWRNNAVGK